MSGKHKKLDNPVWSALSESQAAYVISYDQVKFYHPDYCPFGALFESGNTRKSISAYAELVDEFYLFGPFPQIPDHLQLKRELMCYQMILDESELKQAIEEEIQPLGPEHQETLFELVNRVQPGYFRSKTSEMGRYYGIFKAGKLVAVSGERMRMDGYTEVSAVVTHPDHTRNGYARQLIAHTVQGIRSDGQIPFLHVAASNTGAIRLYEKLGFHTRLILGLWHLGKINS